jgi:hypothetical protein
VSKFLEDTELQLRAVALENGWTRPIVMEAPDFIPQEMTLEEELVSVRKKLHDVSNFNFGDVIPNKDLWVQELQDRLFKLEKEYAETLTIEEGVMK